MSFSSFKASRMPTTYLVLTSPPEPVRSYNNGMQFFRKRLLYPPCEAEAPRCHFSEGHIPLLLPDGQALRIFEIQWCKFSHIVPLSPAYFSIQHVPEHPKEIPGSAHDWLLVFYYLVFSAFFPVLFLSFFYLILTFFLLFLLIQSVPGQLIQEAAAEGYT
mgnify:CR=1 FL=1